MIQAEQKINQALQLHQSGHLVDAVKIYEEVLLLDEDNVRVLFLMGTAFAQMGRYKDAEHKLERCVALNDPNPFVYLNLGNVQVELGLINQALASYALSIKMDPNLIEGHLGRGNLLWRLKQLDEAIFDYDSAINLRPDHSILYFNRAAIQWESNRPEKALEGYLAAIRINPDYSEAYSRYGNILWVLGRIDESLTSYNRAIINSPSFSEAYSNRGNVLWGLRRLDESLESYRFAIALNRKNSDAYSNRGNVLQDLGRYDEALTSYESALTINPGNAKAYYNLGNIHQDMNNPAQALANYDGALKIHPGFDYCAGAREHAAMHLCSWTDYDSRLDSIERDIDAGLKVSTPFPMVGLLDSPLRQRMVAETFAKDRFPSLALGVNNFQRVGFGKRIKIGYYSSDFRNHATMHLMAEMFESHNREKFDLYAFSFGPRTNDLWQKRAIKSFDHYIDVGDLTDQSIAEKSRDLGIDIAVDLKGFTQESRCGIFSRRAAPIQVSFLGYPGTMGSDYIDYLIADRFLIPEENQIYFAEKMAYLPGCYQPNCKQRLISEKPISRSDCCLPDDALVFCSFNANWKITPQVFSVWMNILKKVEGSVLWLLATNETAEKNLKTFARAMGVKDSRLIFANKVPVEEHLRRISLADIMLDTYPCGAHTTCSDALRVGLPLLTQIGETFASRVAGSLLSSIGMPELITSNKEEYEAVAIRLGNDREELRCMRNKLLGLIDSSSVYDPVSYVLGLERLYERMIDRYKSGAPASNILLKQSI